jgi:hypothetical protein
VKFELPIIGAIQTPRPSRATSHPKTSLIATVLLVPSRISDSLTPLLSASFHLPQLSCSPLPSPESVKASTLGFLGLRISHGWNAPAVVEFWNDMYVPAPKFAA